jgi:hypothetical protein
MCEGVACVRPSPPHLIMTPSPPPPLLLRQPPDTSSSLSLSLAYVVFCHHAQQGITMCFRTTFESSRITSVRSTSSLRRSSSVTSLLKRSTRRTWNSWSRSVTRLPFRSSRVSDVLRKECVMYVILCQELDTVINARTQRAQLLHVTPRPCRALSSRRIRQIAQMIPVTSLIT